MRISSVYKSYFNGFKEIKNYKENDKKTNACAAAKILSYFTGIAPLCVAGVYWSSRGCCGKKQKHNQSHQDQKADNQGRASLGLSKVDDTQKTQLDLSDPSKLDDTQKAHLDLANTILSSAQAAAATRVGAVADQQELKKIVYSIGFLENPVKHLVNLMVDRGVGRFRTDDNARGYVMSQIPSFAREAGSIDFLRSVADARYDKKPNKKKIMEVLERSFADPKFTTDLKNAIDEVQNCTQDKSIFIMNAENTLRTVLDVFTQAEWLERYHISKNAGLESLSKS